MLRKIQKINDLSIYLEGCKYQEISTKSRINLEWGKYQEKQKYIENQANFKNFQVRI